MACTSQPKTLLAGPAFGLSKTVSVPVQEQLNTDGAATPACSADRMGRSEAQPSLLERESLFCVEPLSSGLLEKTHVTLHPPAPTDTHLHPLSP